MELEILPALYKSWPFKKNCRIGIARVEGISNFEKFKQVVENIFFKITKKMAYLDFLLLLSTSDHDATNDYFPYIT